MRSTPLQAPLPVSSGRPVGSACAAMPRPGSGAAQRSALLCGWAPFRRRKVLGMRITPRHASLCLCLAGGADAPPPHPSCSQPSAAMRAAPAKLLHTIGHTGGRRACMQWPKGPWGRSTHNHHTHLRPPSLLCVRSAGLPNGTVRLSGDQSCTQGAVDVIMAGSWGVVCSWAGGGDAVNQRNAQVGWGRLCQQRVRSRHCSLEIRAAAFFVRKIACTARCLCVVACKLTMRQPALSPRHQAPLAAAFPPI